MNFNDLVAAKYMPENKNLHKKLNSYDINITFIKSSIVYSKEEKTFNIVLNPKDTTPIECIEKICRDIWNGTYNGQPGNDFQITVL